MDFLIEIILNLYLEFAFCFVPHGKLKKWHENFLRILCFLVSVSPAVLIPFGFCLVFDNDSSNTAGIILLVVGWVIFLIQIVLFFILYHIQKTKEISETETTTDEQYDSNDPKPITSHIDLSETSLSSEDQNIEPPKTH